MLRVAPSGFPFAKEFAVLDAEIVKLQLCKPAQGLSRPEKFVRYCADKLPLLTKAGICVRELRLGRPGDARVTYVYILRSVDHPKRYYVGVTAALRDRLSKHNSGDVSHTSKYAPWTIRPTSHFPTKGRPSHLKNI